MTESHVTAPSLATPDALRTHIDYTTWASKRIVEAAGKLTPEELTRDFGTSAKSVLGTLVHTFAADRVWLRRVEGEPPAAFMDAERDMHLKVLVEDWPAILAKWETVVSAHDPATVFNYQDLKGQTWQSPLWQIVMHLVNHATHHRGQVSGFLRAMGHTPPPLDLIVYYRALSA